MGLQLGFGNGEHVPMDISDEWPWDGFKEMDIMSLWVNPSESICQVGMLMNQEFDTIFCGMRLLNCEGNVIQEYVWGGNSCEKSLWTDEIVPKGMSIIGVKLHQFNREIKQATPIGIGFLLWEFEHDK